MFSWPNLFTQSIDAQLSNFQSSKMTPKIEIIHDERLVLGEGPHWDHEAQVLYYVDIDESIVFKYVPSTKKITRVFVDKKEKTHVSFVIPVAGANDKFVIGYGKKLAVMTWDGESTDPTSIEILVEVEPGLDNRFNDGKADPSGRLWTGTMQTLYELNAPQVRTGALYSFNAHSKSAEPHFNDVGISNGLAWSIDHKTFYYNDTYNEEVHAFDFNMDSGKLANRRTVFDFKKNKVAGGPDGMTIDKEGKLWFASYKGSAIHRIDPKTGSLLQSVEFPTPLITSVTWGGPNLDELYVTSCSTEQPEDDLYAGRLFKITGLGTSGFPGVATKL